MRQLFLLGRFLKDIWDEWRRLECRMEEGMPAQDFHSQAISPALPLTAFRALPAAQLQLFCTPTQPNKLWKQLILLSRGRALQGAPSSRGSGTNREGGRRPALARVPLWHILTWSALQLPRVSIRNCTEELFQWTQDTWFRRLRQSLYAGTYKLYMKHNYAGKKPQHTLLGALDLGFF